jgi:RecG-like helicase
LINFEITATPTIGKRVELEQSIESIQQKLQKISPFFKVQMNDEGNYLFSFAFNTEEETHKLLDSDEFVLFAGAIKTLCKKQSLTLNNREEIINLFDCKNLLNIKDYINIKKGVTYAN